MKVQLPPVEMASTVELSRLVIQPTVVTVLLVITVPMAPFSPLSAPKVNTEQPPMVLVNRTALIALKAEYAPTLAINSEMKSLYRVCQAIHAQQVLQHSTRHPVTRVSITIWQSESTQKTTVMIALQDMLAVLALTLSLTLL